MSSHRLILKTCGTTLNLLGLPRILAIAKEHAGFPEVYRLFYSRKAFMFPDKQLGPHRDWALEIEYLDRFFDTGAAYTVGKVNGDHWLLYMTSPADMSCTSGSNSASEKEAAGGDVESLASSVADIRLLDKEKVKTKAESWSIVSRGGLYTIPVHSPPQDYTIEILMSHLGARPRAAFYTPDFVDPTGEGGPSPAEHAQQLSSSLGITDIFPRSRTTLDAYAFSPCGYSANALIEWDDGSEAPKEKNYSDEGEEKDREKGEGYYTIHVTPEDGWSYASFECNVPLAPRSPHSSPPEDAIPDLRTLIQRVVRIFEPGKLTLTLFVAADSSSADDLDADAADDEAAVDAAQKAFKAALARVPPSKDACGAEGGRAYAYKRTDKINYEFGGYDLAFATFEMVGRST